MVAFNEALNIINQFVARMILLYRVSHNLWQFPGNWLQIVNYCRYSNFEAIFEMPCLFTVRKVLKIAYSAKIRVLKLLFFKATKKTLGADFLISIFGGRLLRNCISTFFSQY